MKEQGFPTYSMPLHLHNLPYYQHSPQNGTFAQINELALAHCYHSKSIICFGVVHSMGLKKFIMTCIHHCNITLITFTSLQILCSTHSSFSSPAPSNQSSFHCLHNFVFSRMSRSWNPALNCSLGFVAWRDHQNYNNSMRKVFFSPFHIPDTESQVIAGDHRAGESDSRSSDPFPQGLQVWRGEGSDDGDSLLSGLQGFSHVNDRFNRHRHWNVCFIN